MKKVGLLIVIVAMSIGAIAQTNITFTNPTMEQVLKGNFTPSDYLPTVIVDDPATIASGLVNNMSTDSLKQYLLELSLNPNRNTGSDTTSSTIGIGAARRWAAEQFITVSNANENRLLVGYLQFDRLICNVGQHRDVVAVLPGTGPQFDEMIFVEAHMDSRCEDACDSLCLALGMEDNGSGTALVLELARVMAPYTYNRTLVFMLTIGEEQGLYGSEAMAEWCNTNDVLVNAVFNNDIVGGVILRGNCFSTRMPRPQCHRQQQCADLFGWNLQLSQQELGSFYQTGVQRKHCSNSASANDYQPHDTRRSHGPWRRPHSIQSQRFSSHSLHISQRTRRRFAQRHLRR